MITIVNKEENKDIRLPWYIRKEIRLYVITIIYKEQNKYIYGDRYI